MARGHAGPGWRARPRLATAIAGVATAVPAIAGIVAALALARALPRPAGGVVLALWWAAVLVVPLLLAPLVERASRRALPLAYLLRLSLVFPDRTPSRYRVARDANRLRRLRSQLLDPDAGAGPTTATETLALIAALEAHDRHTRGHSGRVLLFVDLLAEELGLDDADRHRLRWAALLHDIGKLDVAPEVLNKDGRPDDHEWEALRRHPSVGMRLAAPIVTWLGPWRGAIAEHHERWDGTGYPRGLRGTEISLAGRITAVADVYETLTAGRPYRSPVRPDHARTELVRVAGTQLDPRIVRAFLAIGLGRLNRATRVLAPLATAATLLHLRAVPARARDGAVATTAVAALAVTGALAPPTPAPDVPTPAPLALDGPGARPTEPPSGAPLAPRAHDRPATPTTPSDGADAGAGQRPPRDPAADGPGPGRPDAPDDGPDDRPDDTPPADEPRADEPPADEPPTDATAGSTGLYLGAAATGGDPGDELPLAPRRPTRSRAEVDDLRLAPAEAQAWTVGWDDATVAAGPVELVVWVAGDDRGPLELGASLERCAPGGGGCTPVGSATARTSGRDGAERVSLHLTPSVTFEDGASLRLTLANRGALPLRLGVGARETPAALVLPSARPARATDVSPDDPADAVGDLPPVACLSPVAEVVSAATGPGCADLA